MYHADLVPVYDSQGSDYQAAFRAFLEHTDQKERAKEWLDRFVAALPRRNVFIDAGAGTGKVTAWYAGAFQRCLAIEPNPHLRIELVVNCPTAEIVPANILDAAPDEPADLVLVSHVFYYIPREEWQTHLEVMSSWLSETGVLVVVLQNHATDCMQLVRHYLDSRFNLTEAAAEFVRQHGATYRSDVETVSAQISTPDLATMATIAAFMLNLRHDFLEASPRRPTWGELERYLAEHARTSTGLRLSCDQDFLTIRRG